MLLFYEKPFKNETLSSFTFRTAKKNQMNNLNWILENFETYSSFKLIENEINWLESEKLSQFSLFLGTNLDVTYSMTYTHYLKSKKLNYNNFQKNNWFLYSKQRICPLCLKESAYQRKNWGSSFTTICIKHKALLLDKCPICGCSFSIKSSVLNQCQSCNQTISSFETCQISEIDLLTFQEIIKDGISNDTFTFNHNWINNFETFILSLEFIALWGVQLLDNQDFLFKELNIEYDGQGLERHSLKNSKSVEQALCIYYYSYKVLVDWPYGFHRFLKKADLLKKPKFDSFINNIMPALTMTPLEPISRELNKYYLIKHFGTKELGKKDVEFIRSEDIKCLNSKFNATVVKEDYFKIYCIEEENVKLNLIKLSELQEWLELYEDSLTKGDLMKRWNLSSKAATCFLKSKLVSSSFKYRSGAVSTWVVPRKEIEEFEKTLMNSTLDNIDSRPFLLNQAIEWIGPENTVILFNGMLEKKIRYSNISGNFHKIALSKEDLYFYGKEKIINNSLLSEFIPYRDIEFILGVKKSDIEYWIKDKRFRNIKNLSGSRIPIKQFILFQQQFLTTLELSFLTKISIRTLLKKVSSGKLPIISGPKLDNSKRILFDRDILTKYF